MGILQHDLRSNTQCNVRACRGDTLPGAMDLREPEEKANAQ